LLLSIFDPNTPLHDGAVIVRGGHILAAACVLPLTTAFLADRRLGLRHRAGIGITESTDAIAIIVSEERGSISIAHNGRIIRRLDADRLGSVLRAFYQAELRRALPLSVTWLRRQLERYRGRSTVSSASPGSTGRVAMAHQSDVSSVRSEDQGR
jgi:diadenylate cyclase